MKKFLNILAVLVLVAMSAALTACGDDEPNDPNMPEAGTWSISGYDYLSVRFDHGSCTNEYWDFWENEFQKEIAKRKIKINKNTEMEGNWYVLSKDDHRDNIGYLSDVEKLEVISVTGKVMKANYYLKQYLSVIDDDTYVIFRAEVTLTKK